MKPDVIVSWPRDCDYPLWREFITRERERFGRILCVLTDRDGVHDYSAFLRSAFPVEWIDSPDRTDRDWRDVAVNAALDRSGSEYVWFTEQDFVVTDPDFWTEFTGDLTGVTLWDGRPLHPACLLTTRRYIERTQRYFGTPPIDHFYTFGMQLAAIQAPRLITSGWRHWQAISESQGLVARGEAPRFRPEQFTDWLTESLTADVLLDPRWRAMAEAEIAHPRNGRSRVHR